MPDRIEDYVASDAAVRVIDSFADRLDLSGLGFRRAVSAGTGRPGYDPRDLLKLYLYSYSNGTQASACEDDRITPCVPANRTVNNTGDGTLFDRAAFAYDRERHRFTGPSGQMRDRKQIMNKDRLVL